MPRVAAALVAALLMASASACHALDDGLAQTPQMGWNTWNAFGDEINETLVMEHTDLLVELGLRDLGYANVIVDDGWSERRRTPDGRLEANRDKFPSGIDALGAYIHARGLKFGIYSDSGRLTCQGYPGSRGYEEADARLWASAGVDYLKYDNCWAEDDLLERFKAMRDAIRAAGRPMVYSLCSWGVGDPWLWGSKVGHSWRTTMDIGPSHVEVIHKLDDSVGLARYAGPGGFNDLDMLEVGNFPPSEFYFRHVERAHFALWALLKSPLLIGADLRRIHPDSLAVLRAREVIAVNQDELGVAGDLIWKQGPKEIFAAPLASGRRAVAFFSRHTHKTQASMVTSNITLHFDQIGYVSGACATVRDLYAEKDLGVFMDNFTATVGIHDVQLVSLTPIEPHQQYSEWRPWHGQPLFTPHPEDTSWIQGLDNGNVQMTRGALAKLQRGSLAAARLRAGLNAHT